MFCIEERMGNLEGLGICWRAVGLVRINTHLIGKLTATCLYHIVRRPSPDSFSQVMTCRCIGASEYRGLGRVDSWHYSYTRLNSSARLRRLASIVHKCTHSNWARLVGSSRPTKHIQDMIWMLCGLVRKLKTLQTATPIPSSNLLTSGSPAQSGMKPAWVYGNCAMLLAAMF